ncbi:MAG: glycosyltransferase [Gemmatimonadota bacterium]|nr:glycosyltransferase [Gemmatimonadota bacterium]
MSPVAVGGADGSPTSPYALIHVVFQEMTKDLIGSQVVDHMAVQQITGGPGRPTSVGICFLESGRDAFSSRVKGRLRTLQARAPLVWMRVFPVIGRLSLRTNARLLGRGLRRLVGDIPVVFHCRTESAAEWSIEIAKAFPRSGIVSDIRGAWPLELLYARGYDGTEGADNSSLRSFHSAMARMHRALEHSGSVISVSRGMLDWLASIGVDRKRMTYVPCCVTGLTYSSASRVTARARLGLDDRLVFAYLGTMVRYQHIDDGVAPFFRAILKACPAAHLLCLTDEPERMRQAILATGIDPSAVTALNAPQHEVPAYLAAADCGLILRAPAPINRLWQPTKLGEYLACGLPIVVTEGTGVVGELVSGAGAGTSVRIFGVDGDQLAREAERVCRMLAQRGEEMRAAALALCERHFLWSGYVMPVRDAYESALRWGG